MSTTQMTTATKTPTIKANDQVQVISGREKGKTGKVLRVSRKSGRVTIERVNLVKRHVKPSQQHPQGGIVEKELPIHYSNILLFCAKCNRGVRHGIRLEEKAQKKGAKKTGGTKTAKVRFCKRCKETLDVA